MTSSKLFKYRCCHRLMTSQASLETDVSMASGGKEIFSPFYRRPKVTYTELMTRRKKYKQMNDDAESTKTVLRLSETVLNGFEVLWRQNILCDVIIFSQDRTFHAHKVLLVACSDFFYDLFVDQHQQSPEVHLQQFSSDVLEAILRCMYTGKIHVSEENIEDILQTSIHLGFYLIQDACEEFLIECTNVKNCIKMLDRSFKFNLIKLGEKALGIAATYFKAVSRRPQFKLIPVEQLLALLKRDDLDANNELEVFQKMVDWILHSRQQRLQHTADLMGAVRLPLLAPSVIVDSVESVMFLMDIPDCQRLVKEALHYHCMPSRQSVLQSPRTVPRNRTRKSSLVIFGGAPRLKTNTVNDQITIYNATEDSWDFLTNLVEPRHHLGAVILGGFLYIAGGERTNDHSTPESSMFRYDPRNNSWLQVASMKHKRQSFQMTVLNNMIYAIGGRVDKNESLASVERYNPYFDVWEEVAPLSSPKRCIAIGTLNGRIYAVGGSGNKMISSKVECFNPNTNRWDMRKPISIPRFFAHLIPFSGSMLLIGGATINPERSISCVEEIERYSVNTDTWSEVTKMNTPRAEFGCCAMGDKIYIAGGYNWNTSERLSTVECLDMDTLIWTKLKDLSEPWTGLSCIVIPLYADKIPAKKRKAKSLVDLAVV